MKPCACCGEPGATFTMENGELLCLSCWMDVESVTLEELEAADAIFKRAAIEARER